MEKDRQWQFIWRWCLFAVVLLTIFWVVWFLIAHRVPVFNQIKIDNFGFSKNFILPFEISRWWDIPASIVWVIGYILIFGYKPIYERFSKRNDDNVWVIANNICAGIFIGLILLNIFINLGYLIPIYIVLPAIFLLSAISEIMYGNPEDFKENILCNISLGLSIGLGTIFTAGLTIGLVISIISFTAITFIQFTVIKLCRLIIICFIYLRNWLVLER